MARKKEEEKILDVNAAMQGSLVFSDPVSLRINGKFEGTLKTKGNLIIGQNAHVYADIEGENIVISGFVKGKIRSSEKISVTSTGNVEAEIHVPLFSIEEGALFNGKCVMGRERLSLPELSHYLDIEEKKIMAWVEEGSIPSVKENNGLFFDRKEVETWLSQER